MEYDYVLNVDKAGIKAKYNHLRDIIMEMDSVAVAFSGGVDSSFLLKVAHDILGENAIAVTARSCSFPERELNEARIFCAKEDIKHCICRSEELEIEGFSQNPKNRCYLCKSELFTKIWDVARRNGVSSVAEGSNVDDEGDYRPGLKAVSEYKVRSPLREAGLKKDEIRALSKMLDMSTWNKQSFACLSSRFVYGESITVKKLKMVELAEQLLLDMGFRQVRVRIHGDIARIELEPDELIMLLDAGRRSDVLSRLKELGFSYVTLDLQGYRTGSMNEVLPEIQY
ncbi:MAG: ATP-dependent sacrificial sulfur transferase LarE [Clostridiales Family XIII bacterium]|nr:ATP-dependent sacrificial sulfur transferase LarE [Clostridiales Family XIII bacterium]